MEPQVWRFRHSGARSAVRLSRGRRDWGSVMEQPANQRHAQPGSAFKSIRAIDYTVIFARDMTAMRRFYEDVLGFSLSRELSPGWLEYRIGDNTLALARPSLTAADAASPEGSASLQLAFKVSTAEVDQCADELVRQGIELVSPPTDQSFGHRTLFFRDPDGNLLEVFAEI
jgi:catechol 2,3-dioxygenase-like lactoylglutathione lyase family enzyme